MAHLDTQLSNVARMSSVSQADIARLDEALASIEAREISLNESLSHFEDIDIAEESTSLLLEQLRQQSASSIYTQANAALPQAQFVLTLLP